VVECRALTSSETLPGSGEPFFQESRKNRRLITAIVSLHSTLEIFLSATLIAFTLTAIDVLRHPKKQFQKFILWMPESKLF